MAFANGRKYKSKVGGICARCGGAISIGDEISWARSAARGMWHKHCADLPLIDPASLEQHAIQVSIDQPSPQIVSEPVELTGWRYSLTPPVIDPESGERVTEIAEDWRRDSAELPWQIVRCCQCLDLMATRDPKKHDCCESCGYRIRDEFYERRKSDIRRATDQLVNPFLSRDPFREGVSFPSVGPSRRR
jgi:hypothetical protein